MEFTGRKCAGQELDVVAKLRAMFDEDRRRFASGGRGDDVLSIAAGYVLGYPLFLEILGQECRTEGERVGAYYDLDAAHRGAVQVLMQEAERLGIDSAPLWEYGRVCRELLGTEPGECRRGLYSTWPECLGDTRRSLPDDYRAAISAGEAALQRLAVRITIDDAARAAGAALRNAGCAAGDWDSLSDRQRDCLRVLRRAGATSADTRKTAEQLAWAVLGKGGQPESLKTALGDLVLRGHIQSRAGRNGGYWLSDRGRALLAAADRDPGAGEATARPAAG